MDRKEVFSDVWIDNSLELNPSILCCSDLYSAVVCREGVTDVAVCVHIFRVSRRMPGMYCCTWNRCDLESRANFLPSKFWQSFVECLEQV